MQVLLAADEALRRLQVTDAERNAILDTFRYVEAHALAVPRAYAGADSSAVASSNGVPSTLANGNVNIDAPKPFTRQVQIAFSPSSAGRHELDVVIQAWFTRQAGV